jgi:hypothetical protein
VNKPPSKPPPNVPEGPELDPDAPASEEEVAQSDALRRALEDPSVPNAAAELARAVALANRPRPLDAALHADLVEKALAQRLHPPGPPPRKQGGGSVIKVFFGASAALAVAASIALIVGSLDKDEAPAASSVAPATTATPYHARSTQPLFDEPFEAPQGKVGARSRPSSGSARVDRIAMARGGDFRENEFTRWGTR